jgi:predicted GNAT superfamily acetyltransferase
MASVAEKHFGKQGYYLWGPVVVDSEFRGHGVLRKLSDAVFEGTRDTYSTAVAFIEDVNHVSRVVHERLGWKAVDGFSVGDSKYNVFWHATA